MSVTLRWEGLHELMADLRQLPEELTGEGANIVQAAANSAAVDIKQEYGRHRVTGNLQDGVIVQQGAHGRHGVQYQVKSTAPHAWLFDNGSQARHYITKHGKRHATGAMWGRTPPTHAFVRAMIRSRHRMYDRLKALLERKGLRVTGDA